MKRRAILMLGIAILAFAPCVNGQSFKEGLKQLGKRVGQQIGNNVEQKIVEKATKQVENTVGKVVENVSSKGQRPRPSATGEEPEEQPSGRVRLPKEHTALFAPIGYDVDASWGIKSIKPVLPPMAAAKQVDWVDKMPNIYLMDNQSVVDEFILLLQCKEDGWVAPLTPAYHRYDLICDELCLRMGKLTGMVEYYNEILSEYDSDDPQWVVEEIENRLVAILDSDGYKRTIRSSLTPLFELNVGDYSINEETRAYFAAHGGYQNAHKAKKTVWIPNPNVKSITTSVSGQTGTVVSEVGAGATVDIDGVQYVLHNGNDSKGGWVFISEVVHPAVAGKDIVIPDYIYYDGKKYSVKSMRADIFSYTTIKSVKLPHTLKELSNAAFRGTPITEIVIPSSVKSLKGSVFQDCTKLSKVTFEGDYLEEFSGSFRGCTSLVSIVCPRRVGSISYDMFAGCTSLTEVVLPENLKEIPSGTFEDCRKLTKINIPPTVTKIGNGAFKNCPVTELDIRNVTEFDSFSFGSCKSLKKVILNSSLKEDFLMETYVVFMECPLLQVKYVNNQYVYPEGFVFVP